jgi:hypothetical protein
MSPQSLMTSHKWKILAAIVILLTIGAEFIVRPLTSSRGCVQVVNQGDARIDDLVMTYGETKVRVGSVRPGQSTNVWFTAAGKGTLKLDFDQKGNPLKGFQVPDFDPAANLGDGFKLVLIMKNDRIERFMDDDESTTPLKRLKESITGWFEMNPRP